METKQINYDGILILPYIKSLDNMPSEVILVDNPQGPGVLETEEVDYIDNSFNVAVERLEKVLGYKIIDEYRWEYMGVLSFTNNLCKLNYVFYMVDITSINPFDEYKENKNIVPIKYGLADIVKSDNIVLLSIAMRYFVNKFDKVFLID